MSPTTSGSYLPQAPQYPLTPMTGSPRTTKPALTLEREAEHVGIPSQNGLVGLGIMGIDPAGAAAERAKRGSRMVIPEATNGIRASASPYALEYAKRNGAEGVGGQGKVRGNTSSKVGKPGRRVGGRRRAGESGEAKGEKRDSLKVADCEDETRGGDEPGRTVAEGMVQLGGAWSSRLESSWAGH
jgi:hypothetical protein